MKIKDIISLIKDARLFIEIKERGSGASFGFYDNCCVPISFLSKEVVAINAQYVDGKRLLIIEF